MIKSIIGSGRYTMVSGSSSSTYVNGYSGLQGVGNMRYNTSTQSVEVYDGNNWVLLNMGHATVGLTGDAESAIEWAINERNERIRLEHLAKDNVTIADALAKVRQAEEQLKVIATLCEKEE